MPEGTTAPSARQVELLEAAYTYVLDHGLADLSLRPLATAIGSSPRVLMFLFGNKDGLVRALLARARTDELAILDRLGQAEQPGRSGQPIGLVPAVERVWEWLAGEEHRPLLRLWAEAYARSLVEPGGAWAGFARATVDDWLAVLAACQPLPERDSETGAVRRTLALAVLRGALLDLLASDDEPRVGAAVRHQLALLRG
ncbi:TetR/AcrR family transcriptional regulator [Streptomyces sp. MK7]|uniref:TetR/AcrR family transcriptional regulator n=1 Tax=Streptomyces sp. MK7 TaxID=3067635 RepID=UPI00292CF658|nr:TetR/AcrR family transcriptional regulator [Streptomyces sp. MK7]